MLARAGSRRLQFAPTARTLSKGSPLSLLGAASKPPVACSRTKRYFLLSQGDYLTHFFDIAGAELPEERRRLLLQAKTGGAAPAPDDWRRSVGVAAEAPGAS